MTLDSTEPSFRSPIREPNRERDLVGSYLDQYELVQVLGEGASAVVYEGIDHGANEPVAVKVLKNARQTAAIERDRFMDELRVSNSLSHLNLVTARDGGIARGHPYLVMRLASRGSLQDILAHGRLSDRASLEVVSQVGSALDAIHQQGLVHRDVKPGNVLVDEAPGGTEYLLTDMGIIQPLSPNVSMHPGTIGYSAPEQMLGRLVDRRADVFSLGCLAFTCLTGVSPWHRGTSEATRVAVLDEPVPSIKVLRPELPETVQAVFERALAKSHIDRPRSATAFSRALESALDPESDSGIPEAEPLGHSTLEPTKGWALGTIAAGSLGLVACVLGFLQLDAALIGLGLVGFSAASYLLFRPRHIAVLRIATPSRQLLESVAIDLRRTPGWTSKPSRQGEVIVESRPGVPSLTALIPLALLGVLPAITALLAMRRRSRIRVREVTTDDTDASEAPVTLGIGTSGFRARGRGEALLTKLARSSRGPL